ncbi:fumarylacetoacetate hydrolase family protein [Dactylosporangium sp. NPDC051485]|uniref:fumarylacetoacetate hydrolase family protein n=1 Tax=Dactylosporangium sp. NPDC051485 TaxID=3154846 RepID=UPI00342F7469
MPHALPIDLPGKIICVGLNYRDHAEESGATPPTFPVLFGKWATSLVAHGSPIVIPAGVEKVDYEAELALVIGREGRDIAADDALDYVAGYTCFNDISSRADQALDGQWTRGKSYDTFAPVGPRLVPASELPDPQNLEILCRLDGEVVQRSNTRNMIFSLREIIAAASRATTLLPGDLIATGTPGGVGMSFTPPRWLTPGSTIEVEIEGIGTLSTPIVAESA